jgi:cation diffusion facilitator family transporter
LIKTDIDRRRMMIAFTANIAMFIIGLTGWYFAQSTGLLADAFDMLADASGYIVAMLAISRSERFQKNAARWNGSMLILLGIAVIGEVIHRLLVGSKPQGLLIMGFAALSLGVNGGVLAMLSQYRNAKEVHLKATWIETRADVLVNISVLMSGWAVAVTGYGKIDLIVALAIGVYVIKEGYEIWEATNENKKK